MARHQRMPTQEAGYTYAVVPCAPSISLLANEEESIYGHWDASSKSHVYDIHERPLSATSGHTDGKSVPASDRLISRIPAPFILKRTA